MVRYIVVNENTLAYLHGTESSFAGVLAGSVIRGGHDPKNGVISISPRDAVRPATFADFDAYRVQPPGHLAPERKSLGTVDLDAVSDEDLEAAAEFYDYLVSGKLYQEQPPKLFPR